MSKFGEDKIIYHLLRLTDAIFLKFSFLSEKCEAS